MSRVKTHTYTRTFPRFAVLKAQILNILDEIVNDFNQNHKNTVLKALENRWFTGFRVYAKNKQNLVVQELSFFIDWNKHTIELSKSADMTVNKKWGDDLVMNELKNFALVFSEVVEGEELSTELVYILSKNIDEAKVCRELGLVDASPAHWANGEQISEKFTHRDLQELNIQYRIVQ